MKRVFVLWGIGVLCLLLSGVSAYAGGFSVYEWSARGDALAGTLLARADDPSAVVYNPAGITQLAGNQMLVGMAWLSPRGEVKFKSSGKTTEAKELKHFVPHGYATMQYSDRIWFGIGAYNRFGLANEFDKNWDGNFNNYKASLKTYTVAPTVAFKATDVLSFGASLEIVKADADIRNAPSANGRTKLTGDDVAFGFTLSTHYKPADWIAFGLKYTGPIELKLDGELEATGGLAKTGSFAGSAELALPESLSLGVMVRPTDKLSVEVDAIRTFWSSYKELDVNLKDSTAELFYGNPVTKDWKDVWRFQVGAEYALTDQIDVRAGYVYDQAPNNEHADFMMFPGDRQIFFGGFGYRLSDWRFDASYGYLIGEEIDATVRTGLTQYTDVTYQDINAHLVNVSVSYAF